MNHQNHTDNKKNYFKAVVFTGAITGLITYFGVYTINFLWALNKPNKIMCIDINSIGEAEVEFYLLIVFWFFLLLSGIIIYFEDRIRSGIGGLQV